MGRNRNRKKNVGGMPQLTRTSKNQPETADHTGDPQHSGTLGNAISGKPCNPSTPPKDSDANDHSSQSPYWKKRETWNFIVQTLLLIVGVYVAKIYSCQLGQMVESNSINREALENVQRAFVRVTGITVDHGAIQTPGGVQGHWEIGAHWENSGSTPALNVIQSFDVKNLSDEPDETTFVGGHNPSEYVPSVIGPRAPQDSGILRRPENFIFGGLSPPTKSHPTVIAVGERPIAWGWIAYKDAFDSSHVTEFCQELIEVRSSINRPINAPVGSGLSFRWDGCKHHNCQDKYCSDYNSISDLLEMKR